MIKSLVTAGRITTGLFWAYLVAEVVALFMVVLGVVLMVNKDATLLAGYTAFVIVLVFAGIMRIADALQSHGS